jgi:carboxymethylenebutenolidase
MRRILLLLPVLGLAGCGRAPQPPAPAAPAAEPRAIVTATPLEHWLGKGGARGMVYRHSGDDLDPRPALILVHTDFGLTDWEKAQARRLAGQGYVTLAIDLYRGEAVGDLMNAHIMSRAMDDSQVQGDIKAAVDFLAGRPWVRSDAIGILGWDIGGGYALDAAIRDPRLRAVVVCYGRLTTDPKELAPLRGSVLGIFAGKDEGISAETIGQFRAAMKSAGKRVAGIHTYPAAGHGFMNTGVKAASPEAADAWRRIEGYLAGEFSARARGASQGRAGPPLAGAAGSAP